MSLRDAEFASDADLRAGRRPRFIRAAILQAVAKAARQLGLDPGQLLRQVGLAPTLLNPSDARVPAAAFTQLLRAGAQAASRPDFALLVAMASQPSMLGPLGFPTQDPGTVAEGLATYEHRLKDWNASLSVKLERRQDGVIVRLALLDPAVQGDAMTMDFSLGLALRMLRWTLGESWWPDSVCFSRVKPTDVTAYRRLFGRLVFDHGFNGLVIDAQQLDRRVSPTPPSVAQLIARYEDANADHEDAAGEVRELIARLLPTGHCTIDRAAHHLGVDRRTIHRRLAAEGHSFTELIDQTRRDLIADQIGDKTRSLTAIADMLGFSSLSTFSRWHRAAYGAAARDYRRGDKPIAG